MCAVWLCTQNDIEQWIFIKFCMKLEHSSAETIKMIQKAAAVGNWWLAASSGQHTCSCITSCAKFFSKTINHPMIQPPYSPDLVPCDFWLFPKWKSPLKGKRFQTLDEIQENMTRQLTVTGRTVGGPRVSTLQGTEVSLSYEQCFLYLVPSLINVSIFHITWLDIFWTDLVYVYYGKVFVLFVRLSTLIYEWYTVEIGKLKIYTINPKAITKLRKSYKL